MEKIQRLVRSLKTARSHDLPSDNKQAYYVLLSAVMQNQQRTVADMLLNNTSFDINFACGKSKRTLLHMAANIGAFDCLLFLLKRGAEPDLPDRQGITPIQVACRNGYLKCILKLLEFNANIELRNNDGMTSIHWLAANGRTEVLVQISSYIKNIDVVDEKGQTPLFIACSNGHFHTVVSLIDMKADKSKEDFNGITPLQVSCSQGHAAVVDYLLQAGVKPKTTNAANEIRSAIEGGFGNVVAALLKYFPNSLTDCIKSPYFFNLDIDKVCSTLQYIVKDNKSLHENLLLLFAQHASSEGLKLLSPSSNVEECTQRLLSSIRIFSSLQMGSGDTDQEENLLAENIDDIEKEFDHLWAALNSWMSILMHEENFLKFSSDKEFNNSLPGIFDGKTYNDLFLNQPAIEYTLSTSQVFCDFQRESSNDSSPEHSLNDDTETDPEVASSSDVLEKVADRVGAVIHAFFKFCNTRNSKKKRKKFKVFVEKNRHTLMLLVSKKSHLLFDHFDFILENPILLQWFLPAIQSHPFEERQNWFYKHLGTPSEVSVFAENAVVNISRESLLTSSCKELSKHDSQKLKTNFAVRFDGESGLGSGVTREWICLLIQELLNPDYALFTLSADGSTFQPNSNSAINPDHLSFFEFAGKLMGLALYHKFIIPAYFTRSFYKHILGVPVSFKDVESIDPEYAKSLQWILDNDITELGLEVTFACETDVFGRLEEIELKPGGKNIFVTEDNKVEYVHLAADLRMTKAIKLQVLSFLSGFYEFIPHSLVSLFNEYELELLLSGVPDIDVDDWRKNTVYQAGYDEDSDNIKWFWKIVVELSKEQQAQLLQFATGTSRVPWGGFAKLAGTSQNIPFTISRVSGDGLPTSSTCFNLLKLPEYNNEQECREKLMASIKYGCVGFEFA